MFNPLYFQEFSENANLFATTKGFVVQVSDFTEEGQMLVVGENVPLCYMAKEDLIPIKQTQLSNRELSDIHVFYANFDMECQANDRSYEFYYLGNDIVLKLPIESKDDSNIFINLKKEVVTVQEDSLVKISMKDIPKSLWDNLERTYKEAFEAYSLVSNYI